MSKIYNPEKRRYYYERDKNINPLKSTYQSMLQRCYNTNDDRYKDYGMIGIKVCDRWLGNDGYSNFIKDMGDRPEGYTLDRVDYYGDYCPENCRWASRSTQQRNKRPFSSTGIKYISIKKERGRLLFRVKTPDNKYDKSFKNLEDAKCFLINLGYKLEERVK